MDNTATTWQARADRHLNAAHRYGTRLEGDNGYAPDVTALAALASACMERARIAAAAECPTCEGRGVVPDAGRYGPCPNRVAHPTT